MPRIGTPVGFAGTPMQMVGTAMATAGAPGEMGSCTAAVCS